MTLRRQRENCLTAAYLSHDVIYTRRSQLLTECTEHDAQASQDESTRELLIECRENWCPDSDGECTSARAPQNHK